MFTLMMFLGAEEMLKWSKNVAKLALAVCGFGKLIVN